MNSQPETFWSWLAGFIDGDGCFVLQKGGTPQSLTPVISLSQKNSSVLKYIKEKTGNGNLVSNKRTNFILWSSNQAKIILLKIIPHLQLKKEQGRLLLRACRLNNFCLKRNSQPRFLDAYHKELREIDIQLRKLKRLQVGKIQVECRV